MELIIVKRDTPTWAGMWEWLVNHPINEAIAEPEVAAHEGETWQYMGSYKNAGIVLHQFRHRYHPATNKLCNISFENQGPVPEEDIEKSSKIK